jgi:hypothetical protein
MKLAEIKAKGRTRLYSLIAIILVLCISLSIFISFGLNAKTVNFTCNAESPYSFNVAVKIDLNDGMNQAEARMVAEAIINHQLNSAIHEFKSANVSDSGIWTINFSWGAISPDGHQESLSHYFNVMINPVNKTVTYDRCY